MILKEHGTRYVKLISDENIEVYVNIEKHTKVDKGNALSLSRTPTQVAYTIGRKLILHRCGIQML